MTQRRGTQWIKSKHILGSQVRFHHQKNFFKKLRKERPILTKLIRLKEKKREDKEELPIKIDIEV